MEYDAILEKALERVLDGEEFDDIKPEVQRAGLTKEEENKVLERVDELIYHRELDEQRRSKALGQMLMGGVLLAFPLLIAFLAYDPGNRITYLWYGAALLGAWQLKEGYKAYRLPFEPPENFGYHRKKFQRF